MTLSSRVSRVSESATLKLNALVREMKASGKDVINLTAGEPDFEVPKEAKNAVVQALEQNQNKYTPVPGIKELREAVAEKTNRQQPSLKTPWTFENVVVSNGGKQALSNTFMALLNPGDEVLMISPLWITYPESVKLADGSPKVVQTSVESDFKATPDQIQSALTKKTKILLLNSPSNPAGVMYSKKELQEIGAVLKNFPDVWVLSDEIYDRIVLEDIPFCSFLEACPELSNRTVTVNGMSKSSAMTGWRIGWTVGPMELTKAVIKIQGQSTSGINALAQWASLAALRIPESDFEPHLKSFRRRRDLVTEIFEKVSSKRGKIKVYPPQGAFYAFLGVEDFFQDGEDSIGFAERLLQEAGVAIVPGTPFGEPGFVRLSFATDDRSLQEGCERIVRFIQESSST